MKKIEFLIIMCFFGYSTLVLGQDSIRCFPTKLKNETPNFAVFSHNGKYIAAGIYGAIRVWETDSKNFKDYRTVAKNETPLFVSFSPDNKCIASGVYGAVRVWELNTNNYTDYKLKTINSTPKFVTDNGFVDLSKIMKPNSSSAFLICMDKVGCVTKQTSLARWK